MSDTIRIPKELWSYLRHRPDCGKLVRETDDGRRVPVDPWEVHNFDCTCRLDEHIMRARYLSDEENLRTAQEIIRTAPPIMPSSEKS
jgi:hypothetical protein